MFESQDRNKEKSLQQPIQPMIEHAESKEYILANIPAKIGAINSPKKMVV